MKYRYTLSIALMAHLILIFVLTKFHWSSHTTTGFPRTMIIHGYVFAPRQMNQQAKEKSLEKHAVKSIKPMAKIRIQAVTVSKQANHQQKSRVSSLSHGQHNRLLTALHNAIGEHQVYPGNARMLNQQGTVQVSFVLVPNGNIRDIKILKSSGFPLLDQAAESAVAAISPFTEIKVQMRQSLQISVGFYD